MLQGTNWSPREVKYLVQGDSQRVQKLNAGFFKLSSPCFSPSSLTTQGPPALSWWTANSGRPFGPFVPRTQRTSFRQWRTQDTEKPPSSLLQNHALSRGSGLLSAASASPGLASRTGARRPQGHRSCLPSRGASPGPRGQEGSPAAWKERAAQETLTVSARGCDPGAKRPAVFVMEDPTRRAALEARQLEDGGPGQSRSPCAVRYFPGQTRS